MSSQHWRFPAWSDPRYPHHLWLFQSSRKKKPSLHRGSRIRPRERLAGVCRGPQCRNTVDPYIYAYLCLSMPMLSQTCGIGSAEGVRGVPSSTTNPMRALVAGLFFVAFQHINLNLMQFFQFTHQKSMPCGCFMAPGDQSTVSLSLRALHQLAAVPHEAPVIWALGHGPHLSM